MTEREQVKAQGCATIAYDPALVNELLAYAADHTHEQIVEKLGELPEAERRRAVEILAVATVNGHAHPLTDEYDVDWHRLTRKQRRKMWWQANRPAKAETAVQPCGCREDEPCPQHRQASADAARRHRWAKKGKA